MYNAHHITKLFEEALCEYTGAPYAVALDNCSNALFLCLEYLNVNGIISIPERTYMSVPCEILRAGGKVNFERVEGDSITGSYQLKPTSIWDCALHFDANMYVPQTFQCLSFTGPFKHLKLGKAGAILTDSEYAYNWFKRKRFSGRNECSYHEDHFDMLGYNMYLLPEIAARGLLMMSQFYDIDGKAKNNLPITMKYPKLSDFEIYKK